MEGLDLKRTNERNKRVCEQFDTLRQEADNKEQHYLADKHYLPPMQLFVRLEPDMDDLRCHDPEKKRKHRDKIL